MTKHYATNYAIVWSARSWGSGSFWIWKGPTTQNSLDHPVRPVILSGCL